MNAWRIVLTITWLGSAVTCQQTTDATVMRTLNLHGDRISDLENIVKRLLADNQGLQRTVGELKAENVALKGNLQTLENKSMNCCSKGITQTTTRTTSHVTNATNTSSLSTTTTTGRGSNHTSTGLPTNMVSTMWTYPSKPSTTPRLSTTPTTTQTTPSTTTRPSTTPTTTQTTPSTTTRPSTTPTTTHTTPSTTTRPSTTPTTTQTTPSTTTRPSTTPTTTQTTPSTTTRPSTTPTTTQTTPPSTTQRMQPVRCMICAGPVEICESLYAPTTCYPPNNYCVNTVSNSVTGARTMTRGCGNEAVCKRDWYYTTSDRDVCTQFDERYVYTRSFNCTYCCTTDNCNAQIVPDSDTLYVP